MLSACRPKTANSCSKREFSSLALTSSCVYHPHVFQRLASVLPEVLRRGGEFGEARLLALAAASRGLAVGDHAAHFLLLLVLLLALLLGNRPEQREDVRLLLHEARELGGDAFGPTTFALAAGSFGGAAGLAWVLARVGAGLPFGDDDSSLTTGFASGNPHPALALVARLSATIGSLFVRFS